MDGVTGASGREQADEQGRPVVRRKGDGVKVLVTGAAGFLGGYIVEELIDRGYTVVGLDNLSKYRQPARGLPEHERFTSVVGDAADKDLLYELSEGCAHFIAGAALIGGVRYMKDLAYDILSTNNRLAGAAAEVGVSRHREGLRKVTYVSSSMVYERHPGVGFREGDERETAPPATAYGFQKLAVEYYARAAWSQYGLPYTIVRPFNCVGAGERHAPHTSTSSEEQQRLVRGHVIPDFVERALRRENPFRVLGDGRQFRTFTHARDLARGVVLAMESEAAWNEDFNLSGNQGCTISELARLVWDRVNPGVPFSIRHEPAFPDDVRVRRPDTRKAAEVLGFVADTPIEAMVDEVVAWVRETGLAAAA
ncbi:NAD-dependent epimerase/dehydratase family protein [Streptomyces olivaceoviridis]|uniref:NAD-dependent epimerase/dehydratase family protein n=1 Tax=Streptomyces olivaceoviridis TaxID=1921 RepID=UPI001E32B0D9|nr:NAD-dependent epimerase/dehydratase family protein [Streptomyces olivaceoviridis]